ncbi:MAG TPA: HYR domain-containing protein [Longimicrobium sp.]|nr:HYR domain-containing protein [Longimicrobium sp.]
MTYLRRAYRRASPAVVLLALAACADVPTAPDASVAAPSAAVSGHTGALVYLATAPASLVPGALENNTRMYAWNERAGVRLAQPVQVDFADPGAYTMSEIWPSTTANERVLPAGTWVNSHYVHMDVTTPRATTLRATITFDSDIVGVMVTDRRLAATDGTLGAPGTVFAAAARRTVELEPVDRLVISADRRSIQITMALSDVPLDEFRVLTAAPNTDHTPPTITFSGNAGTYTVAQSVNITCTATDEVSGVDENATSCPGASGPAYTFALGTHTLTATATDLSGNSATAQTSFTVTVDDGSLCELTRRWVSKPDVAGAMCVKLQQDEYLPYIWHVRAQIGKTVTAANAAILVRLANALRA